MVRSTTTRPYSSTREGKSSLSDIIASHQKYLITRANHRCLNGYRLASARLLVAQPAHPDGQARSVRGTRDAAWQPGARGAPCAPIVGGFRSTLAAAADLSAPHRFHASESSLR